MEERDDVGVGLLGWILGVEKPRYFQTANCKLCGEEEEFCGVTPEQLKQHLAEGYCCECDDLSEEEKERILKEKREERASSNTGGGGFFAWLLGV
jgi:hypothetical protein